MEWRRSNGLISLLRLFASVGRRLRRECGAFLSPSTAQQAINQPGGTRCPDILVLVLVLMHMQHSSSETRYRHTALVFTTQRFTKEQAPQETAECNVNSVSLKDAAGYHNLVYLNVTVQHHSTTVIQVSVFLE